MHPTLRTAVLGVLAALAVLLVTAPLAAAEPWVECGPHSLEEETVRVFPRTATGPEGGSSELQCGNRYYGVHRLETAWSVPAAARGDWRVAADAAIAHTLGTDTAPDHDARRDDWTYTSPEAVVVVGARGLIIDARPGGR